EDEVSGGGDRATPHRQILFDRPDLFARLGVPRLELTAVTAGTGIHLHVHADVGRARDVIRRQALLVHAKILMRDVQHPRAWRGGGRLPIFHPRCRGTDLTNDLAELGLLFRIVFETAGLEIDPGGRIHEPVRLGRNEPPRWAVPYVNHSHAAPA